MFSQSSNRPFADSHTDQLTTPARQFGSRISELPQTPISERFEPHSRHSSVQPEVVYHGDEANWEENMMIRKMREASAMKSQLADEKKITSTLKGDLAASQKAGVALKQKLTTVESENERQAEQIQNLTEQLSHTKLGLDQVTEDRERNVNLMQDKAGEIERLRSELLHAGDKYAACEERAEKIKDTAKKGVVHLNQGHASSSLYESLKTTFNELKLRFDVSQDNLQRTKDEIELLKSTSGQQMKLVGSYLDETGRYLHKSAETRDLISELQQDRNSSQQVNDILREKLHSLSAQLVESKQKIAELELRQFEEGARWSRRGETWQNLQCRIEELADRLAKREGEAFEGLIQSANLSTALNEAIERGNALQVTLGVKEKELTVLKKEAINAESAKVKELDAALKDLLVKLAKSDATVHKQETQMSIFNDRMRSLTTKEAALIESNDDARRTISKLEMAIQEAKFACSAESTKHKQVQDKNVLLEAQIGKLRADVVDRETSLKNQDVAFNVLQERFDNQTITLKLAKDHSGDLQERIMALMVKLEGATTSAQSDLAHLREQKASLEVSIQDQKALLEKTLQDQKALLEKTFCDHRNHLEHSLQEQRTSQERKLQDQKDVWKKFVADQQALFDRNLEDQKAAFETTIRHLQEQNLSLRNSLTQLQTDFQVQQEAATTLKIDVAKFEERCEQQAKSEAQKLQAANKERLEASRLAQQKKDMLNSLTSECESAKKDAQKARSELESGLREARMSTEQTRELQEEVERLRDREMTMPKRYEAGQLGDIEKSFVQSVIQMYRATCEQDIVNKENDLRSRDNMIMSLQSKIASLESTLAKCLKESGMKSMLDLNMWMSSPLTQRSEVFFDLYVFQVLSDIFRTRSFRNQPLDLPYRPRQSHSLHSLLKTRTISLRKKDSHLPWVSETDPTHRQQNPMIVNALLGDRFAILLPHRLRV
ncbi:hypothetical protein IW261DRAFT_1589586 [Armillaria novae-zelandiae]|uniref:Uncharacterized protein n=1 Tax=Armillaria novae-zelandiae TaxID=153914 RepID=A0AA39PML0_9AGAR|nr:hypothetical protein IW261DRAFT_1589586 [Armillaria novae-zelandiae]